MSSAALCRACRAPLPAGRAQCIACGAVHGEDNRCPSCHDLAALRRGVSGYVCVACGAPRERLPQSVVLRERILRERGRGLVLPWRIGAVALRAFGVLAVASGIITASVFAAFVTGPAAWILAASFGGTGAILGALALRAAVKASKRARTHESADLELRLLAFAQSRGGKLTATEVARDLGISTIEAEAALTALCDGTRVSGELTEDGRVEYHFREVAALGQPKVRVAVDRVEDEAAEDEADERVERKKTRG